MESILKLFNSPKKGDLYCHLNAYLVSMRNDPIIPLLTLGEPNERSLDELFFKIERDSTPKATANLLQAILLAEVATTFYKINVHAALTPTEIKKQFLPIFDQAKLLEKIEQQGQKKNESAGKKKESTSTSSQGSLSTSGYSSHTPVVTVSYVSVRYVAMYCMWCIYPCKLGIQLITSHCFIYRCFWMK